MQAERTKQYFSLRRGLNTLSNEITFPDEYTSAERNYTIEADGSRRRRRGLDREASGSTKTVATITAGQANRSFLWEDAGGIKNLFVHQFGSKLYFSDDAEVISTSYNTNVVDLSVSTYKVSQSTTATTIGAEPCSFAVHRGHLVVTNKYLRPLRISYDGTSFTTKATTILVRDFEGIDDGVAIKARPTATPIDGDHLYNLLNRGWTETDINAYQTSETEWPDKSMIPYLGYKRTYAANIFEADGTRSFDAVKMAAEYFGKSSAPQGSLFLNPLDTTTAVGASDVTADKTLSFSSTNSPTTNSWANVTSTLHGYTDPGSNGTEITVSGHLWEYTNTLYGEGFYWSLDGTWTFVSLLSLANYGEVAVVDANTLRFHVGTIDPNFSSWDLTDPDGVIDGGPKVTNSAGKVLDVGPTACGSFAGRVWYAGIPDSEWNDTIFFSQVALKPTSFGLCHQKADPTDEFNNQLRPDDGGTIIIPNLGQVTEMIAQRNAILIFSTNGVWEISGGRGGFTADQYSVRKITDIGCTSGRSVIKVEDSVIYTGPHGVISLSPNQYTGLLEPAKMSEVIEPTWNAITTAAQARVQCAYDDAKNRIYVLYDTASTLSHAYDHALVFDMKNQGWYPLEFNGSSTKGILTMFAISDADNSESNQKIKFQCQQSTTTVDTCDMNQTDYVDFDQVESPLPYLVTGWDTSYGFQNKKQAPIIHVYNKRTETGWVDAGGGDWSEVNGGSTLMTPFWDWTESVQWDDPSAPTAQEPWDGTQDNFGVSGKIGRQVETYRRLRNINPLTTTTVDGYPIVATRHKVRGRGRSLSMRFDGTSAKDSHLLGYTVNYRISRSK